MQNGRTFGGAPEISFLRETILSRKFFIVILTLNFSVVGEPSMRSNERIKQRYFEELEQECLTGLAKSSTFVQRKKAVNYFIKFLNMSTINLKNVNSLHIQDFLQSLSQKKTYQRKSLAPATLKQIYALVRSFYVRCYEKGITTEHPDRIFTKKLLRRYKLGERKLPKYIDQEKMKQLLRECPEKWKALLHFMYDTGARISEVLNVQQQHLDLRRKLVQIYEPKTMNVRLTTLSNKTVQLLREYFSKYRPEPRIGHESFLFINQQRRRMSPRGVQYIVKKVSSEKLGEENAITPHYFRAACAVHLLESGVDIRQVQEIIGWKSLGIVQNYTRVTPQRQAELKEKHHPGFQSTEKQISSEEPISSIASEMRSFRLQLTEEQRKHQKELEVLKKTLQEEQHRRIEDRRAYEQQIGELVKSQQQLIQLLSQKTT
ncbi:MAG: tyrosine-type recombinase/integrase [Promethearchaeota archaeon]